MSGNNFMKIQIVIVNLSTKAVQSNQNIVQDVYSKCIDRLKIWKFEISENFYFE